MHQFESADPVITIQYFKYELLVLFTLRIPSFDAEKINLAELPTPPTNEE